MGFLDKFKKKKDEATPESGSQSSGSQQSSNQTASTGKKIKRYNSEGKPV